MKTRDEHSGFEPGTHPELSDEQIAELRPLTEVFPHLATAERRTRGPQTQPTEKAISLRLDERVIDHFRATGPGWQARMNDALLKAAGFDI